ncbi:MAG: hypothetical protein ACP5KY_08255 [Thermoproteus sp.]
MRGGGQAGFPGFILRFILSMLILWILTVIVAAVIMAFLNLGVDIVGSILQPTRIVERDMLIGAASLLAGWLISMAVVYYTIWRGMVFA